MLAGSSSTVGVVVVGVGGGLLLNEKIQQMGRVHVIGPRTLGFGGFFWHGAWDWGVERVCRCMKGNRLRSRGVLV